MLINYINPLIYEENSRNINKIKGNIPYYKSLAIDILKVDLDFEINDTYLKELFFLNKILKDSGIKLMLSLDLDKLSGKLLEDKIENPNWFNLNIQKAGLSFLNFLVKRGIEAFDFTNLEEIFADDFFFEARKLNKNIRHSNPEIITTTKLNKIRAKEIEYLSQNEKVDFTFIRTSFDYTKKSFLSSIKNSRSNLAIEYSNIGRNLFMNKNYSFLCKSLVLGNMIFLNMPSFINEDVINLKESGPWIKLSDYLLKSISLREKYRDLISLEFKEILENDEDIFAYSKTNPRGKILILNNLSHKEFLLSIEKYIKDYKNYSLILGNYGYRRMVDNLLLRPYESLVFICIKSNSCSYHS